LVDVTGVADK
jgi:hypothetical protein